MPAPARSRAARTDRAIAIVIGGLGVSAAVTQQAMEKLPGPVTFAFSPYGTDVDRLVDQCARADGHEVLLQAPMEPFDYPDNDPGPQTLLTSLSPDQNLDRLYWLMSRFQGYVGVANYMGARFTSERGGPRAGAQGNGAARADLCRRRLVAAQPRRPDRRRQQPALRQGRSRDRLRCRRPA